MKPWTKIGPLGPFRGRLGLAWVIAPLVLGVILLLAVLLLLVRDSAPGGTFVPAGPESFGEGAARPAGVGGAFVARTGGQLFAVAPDPGCPLSGADAGYVDCHGASYALDGVGVNGALDLLPIRVYKGVVYLDPAHPVGRASARSSTSP